MYTDTYKCTYTYLHRLSTNNSGHLGHWRDSWNSSESPAIFWWIKKFYKKIKNLNKIYSGSEIQNGKKSGTLILAEREREMQIEVLFECPPKRICIITGALIYIFAWRICNCNNTFERRLGSPRWENHRWRDWWRENRWCKSRWRRDISRKHLG